MSSVHPNPFQVRLAEIERRLRVTLIALPAMVGAMVVEHSDEAFRNHGWTDETLEPWTPRQSVETTKKGKPKAKQRAILILTGRLRRSIRIVSTTADSVTVGTDVPYAQIHNEGFTGSMRVKGHIRMANIRIKPITGQKGSYSLKTKKTVVTKHKKWMRMPKRKFLGNSHQQTVKIETMIEKQIFKAFLKKY